MFNVQCHNNDIIKREVGELYKLTLTSVFTENRYLTYQSFSVILRPT